MSDMGTHQTNVSGVNRGIVSVGSAGAITNNVGQAQGGLRADDLQRLLAELAAVLPGMPLAASAKAETEAELRTAQAQLASPKPKLPIIRDSLQTIRSILEGMAGDAAYARLIGMIHELVP